MNRIKTDPVILAKARIQVVTRGAKHRKFALRAGYNLGSSLRWNDVFEILSILFIHV